MSGPTSGAFVKGLTECNLGCKWSRKCEGVCVCGWGGTVFSFLIVGHFGKECNDVSALVTLHQ